MKLSVRLTQAQLIRVAHHGAGRAIHAITRQSRVDVPIMSREKWYWEDNIRGAISEFAVCLAFGFPFDWEVGRAYINRPDAGPFEVRTVSRPDAGLRCKVKDVDHQILVLTRVKADRVLIIGWATAGEVREHGHELWQGKYGQHELGQDQLNDIAHIGHEIHWSDQVREYTCLQTG